jgi:hypothetical protein
MKHLPLLLLILSTGFALHGVVTVAAVPPPAQLIVNRATRECALIYSDECHNSYPPEGWEVLGYDNMVVCPAGYTTVEVEPIVVGRKDASCCGFGSEGTGGDCEDVVINKTTQQCAFVEDIHACKNLPTGWEKWGTECHIGPPGWGSYPRTFVACLSDEQAAQERRLQAAVEEKRRIEEEGRIRSGLSVILGAAACGGLALIAIKRKKRISSSS